MWEEEGDVFMKKFYIIERGYAFPVKKAEEIAKEGYHFVGHAWRGEDSASEYVFELFPQMLQHITKDKKCP